MPAWSDGTCGSDIELKVDRHVRALSFLESTGCYRFVREALDRVDRQMRREDRLRS